MINPIQNSTRQFLLSATLGALGVLLVTAGCSSFSKEILPEKVEVKVSRDQPGDNCKLIGPVTGRTMSVHGTETEALEDLKSDAARKGANFVLYDQASAYGTALRGTAYFCP